MEEKSEVIVLPEASPTKRETINPEASIPGIKAVEEVANVVRTALNSNNEIAKDEIGAHSKIAEGVERIANLDIPEEQKDKRIDDLMKVGGRVHDGAEGGRRSLTQITLSILKWTGIIFLCVIGLPIIIVILFIWLSYKVCQTQGPEAAEKFGKGLANNLNNLKGRNNNLG